MAIQRPEEYRARGRWHGAALAVNQVPCVQVWGGAVYLGQGDVSSLVRCQAYGIQ